VDWNKIKAEYIAGGTSYRKLAEKYNVSFTTLTRTAQREDWVGLRQQSENRVTTKILDVVSDKKADKALKIVEVADKLLTKIGEVIDIVSTTQDIRHLTSALKDIKDIKGIKSDADMREQEARIRNLEKQAEKQDESNDVTVTIGSDAEEYST
jgi:transposase